jgi:signal transduction histidine kinase
MNSIFTSLLDYVIQQTNNTHGFIGERKLQMDTVIYRYYAVSSRSSANWTDNGYIDEGTDHTHFKDLNFGEIYINNTKCDSTVLGFTTINIIYIPLVDIDNRVIGILGLTGPTEFTKDIADSYKPLTDLCSYILALALERKTIHSQKNAFLLNVSQSIREPIDGILGVSKLTTNIKLTPVQQQYIDAVTFYSIKLLDTVNDIQDYTKMVSGTLQLINKTISFKQCIDTVMLITQQKVDNTGDVKLTLTTSGSLPDSVVADEIRLTQIMVYLLDNACKFTKKGTVNLHISCSSTNPAAPTHKLDFTVSDTGVGMTAEQVHNIFGSVSRNGWGIQIVKHLVTMFGGTMHITSTLGIGTTVNFTLYIGKKKVLTDEQIKEAFKDIQCIFYSEVRNPELIASLSVFGIPVTYISSMKEFKKKFKTPGSGNVLIFGKASKEDKTTIAQSVCPLHIISTEKSLIREDDIYYLSNSSKEGVADVLVTIKENMSTPSAMSKRRILIAEDDTASCELILNLLKKIGYQEIDTVTDGLELYLKLTSQEYNLVFVSLTLKVLDSIVAVKKYRDSHPNTATSPIIIAVAVSINANLKASCYAAGMNGYVLKPVKATDLAKLDTLIKD